VYVVRKTVDHLILWLVALNEVEMKTFKYKFLQKKLIFAGILSEWWRVLCVVFTKTKNKKIFILGKYAMNISVLAELAENFTYGYVKTGQLKT
jgi:hypothetical protein